MVNGKTVSTGAILAMLVLVPACSSTCSATPDKLAALRRGMSQTEAASVMGCRGAPVLPIDPGSDVVSLEWQGPGTIATATQLDFLGDRLLYYVTRAKAGL